MPLNGETISFVGTLRKRVTMETKTDDAGRESKRASNDEREKERGGERKTMGGIDGESKAMRRG